MGNIALKGQKLYLDNILLPFQGVGYCPIFPRALPWANISLAFQAVYLMAFTTCKSRVALAVYLIACHYLQKSSRLGRLSDCLSLLAKVED
jgi:hypothetical protein